MNNFSTSQLQEEKLGHYLVDHLHRKHNSIIINNMHHVQLITNIMTIIMHFYHCCCDRLIQNASLTVRILSCSCKCATCHLLIYNLNSTRGLCSPMNTTYIYLCVHTEWTHRYSSCCVELRTVFYFFFTSSTSEFCGILINEIHFFL